MTLRLAQIARNFAHKKLTFNFIEFEDFAGFGKLTLNRPKALNSLNQQMLADITKVLPAIENTKAFWMEGAGGKSFCAGGDVKSIYANREDGSKFFKEEFVLDYKMAQLKSIQISNWDGYVMGGGAGISMHSPFRIATQKTVFAMPENKLGIFTDVASGYWFSRLRNNLGLYLGTTGVQLRGEDVYRSGIANYFVSSSDIPKIYEELKSVIPESSDAKVTVEKVISKYSAIKSSTPIQNQDKIKNIFDVESVKQLIQNLQSKPNDSFYQETLKTLNQQSPLSVHVTFENIKRSKGRSLKECFVSDFAIMNHFLQGKDFYEGIRSVLIDKGSKPKWTYQSLKEVPPAQVSKYFNELPKEKNLILDS